MTLTLNLSASLEEFVARQVASGQYASAEEYILSLLREAQQRQARNMIDELLLEGLQTPASEMTSSDWEELRRRVRERQPQGEVS